MQSIQRIGRCALATAVFFVLGCCAGEKEPAARLVGDIEATVTAASSEASKYVPDELADVQSKLAVLKASYNSGNYPEVMARGPAVLRAAKDLATTAAAKEDEVLKGLEERWRNLAGALPEQLTAVQSRIELLAKTSRKTLSAGIDLAAAKNGLSDAAALWSKAQAAFAAGNLAEAVNIGNAVKARIAALAASLKLMLAEPEVRTLA